MTYQFNTPEAQQTYEAHKASRESLSPLGDIALIRAEIQRLLKDDPTNPALIKAGESVAKLCIAAQKELTKNGELFTKDEVQHLATMFGQKAAEAMQPVCLALMEAYPQDPIIQVLHDTLCSAIAGELGNNRCKDIAQREVLKLRNDIAKAKARGPYKKK